MGSTIKCRNRKHTVEQTQYTLVAITLRVVEQDTAGWYTQVSNTHCQLVSQVRYRTHCNVETAGDTRLCQMVIAGRYKHAARWNSQVVYTLLDNRRQTQEQQAGDSRQESYTASRKLQNVAITDEHDTRIQILGTRSHARQAGARRWKYLQMKPDRNLPKAKAASESSKPLTLPYRGSNNQQEKQCKTRIQTNTAEQENHEVH